MSMQNLPLLLPPKDPTKRHLAHWATVTQVSPLRVKVDGESIALPITPDLIIPAVLLNDRVLIQVINRRLCVVGRVATNMDLSGYVRATRSSSVQGSFAANISGDTNDRWIAFSDGKFQWGPGNSALDTNLYRRNPDELATDDTFATIRPNASDLAYTAHVTGDSFRRFVAQADGRMDWGPGNVNRDVNLYRSAAGVLATDGSIQIRSHKAFRGETGVASVTIGTVSSVTQSVSFATAFSVAPIVFVNIQSGSGIVGRWGQRVTSTTTTGFTLLLFAPDTTNSSGGTVNVSWAAFLAD